MNEITCNARKGKKIPIVECNPIIDNPSHPACAKCNSPRNPLYITDKTRMSEDKKEDQPKRTPIKTIKETTDNNNVNNVKSDQPSLHVKHLTKQPLSLEDTAYASGDLNSPFYDYTYVHDMEMVSLMEKKFGQSQNPLNAISCFLYAHESGLYPPMPVMQYFYNIFDKFMTSNELGLDKLFDFKSGRGKVPIIKKFYENARNDKLCAHLYILNKGCKFTIDTSALLIIEMLNRDIYTMKKCPFKFEPIDIDRLKHIFHAWKNKQSDSHKNYLSGALQSWKKEPKEKFLQPVKEILKEYSMEKELERLKKMV